MSTLRVDNLNARTGTSISVPSGTKMYLPGHIIQVQSVTKTDTFTTTTTSGSTQVDITGLSVNITPTSTSSKIFVSCMLTTGHTGDDVGHSYIYIVRNGSNVLVADAAGSRRGATLVLNYFARQMLTFPINYLDSPATTSTLTYKIQAATTADTFFCNKSGRDSDAYLYDGRATSTLTVMEIAQ